MPMQRWQAAVQEVLTVHVRNICHVLLLPSSTHAVGRPFGSCNLAARLQPLVQRVFVAQVDLRPSRCWLQGFENSYGPLLGSITSFLPAPVLKIMEPILDVLDSAMGE